MSGIARFFSSRPIAADAGLLAIRLGIGTFMLVLRGWSKITGGPEFWAQIGKSMELVGITFAPAAWGFLASFAESGCSVLLILGVLFRPAAAMLAFTMLIAGSYHLSLPAGDPNGGWNSASHALELGCVYVGLLLTGPGRFTVARLVQR
jgi:putative oxidoreductase